MFLSFFHHIQLMPNTNKLTLSGVFKSVQVGTKPKVYEEQQTAVFAWLNNQTQTLRDFKSTQRLNPLLEHCSQIEDQICLLMAE